MADGRDTTQFAEIPDSDKGLRACLRCSLVKTFTQFVDSGCENCDFLGMVGENDKVHDCTTAYFEGTVALIQPGGSWVARWQRIVTYAPGEREAAARIVCHPAMHLHAHACTPLPYHVPCGAPCN